jgi:hypothetical protein
MRGEINLAHSSGPEQAHDPEASKSFPRAQWHEPHTTNSGRAGFMDPIGSIAAAETQARKDHFLMKCASRMAPVGEYPEIDDI